MIFKSAGQNFLVACDCKAASTEPLSKWNKGVVMLYRVYKVLGLLSFRCCEGRNMLLKSSVIGNEAPARPPVYLS